MGELLTASKMNTDLRDGLTFLLTPPRALLHMSSNQSIPNNAYTSVTWNSEQYDNDGAHSDSTNPSRYTAQTAGWFEFHALVNHDAVSSAGDRFARFLKNGTTTFGLAVTRTSTTNSASNMITGWSLMAVGDYVEASTYQNSGSAQNVIPISNGAPSFLTARWIGKN